MTSKKLINSNKLDSSEPEHENLWLKHMDLSNKERDDITVYLKARKMTLDEFKFD